MKTFKKIQGIKKIIDFGLPTPETIFILNYKKQGKEIDEFIKNREFVMIRSDAGDGPDFCPHNLRCPQNEAKAFIKELLEKGYGVILQEHVPWDDDKFSGNILILKDYFIIELMVGGPLILMNRDGQVDEYFKINRKDFKEVEHLGKRLISRRDLQKVLQLLERLPPYRLAEFSIGSDWLYFWQIREDKTTKSLDGANREI